MVPWYFLVFSDLILKTNMSKEKKNQDKRAAKAGERTLSEAYYAYAWCDSGKANPTLPVNASK